MSARPDLSRIVRDPAVEKDDGDLGDLGAPPTTVLDIGAFSAAPIAGSIEDGVGSGCREGQR